jgi:hypothetical protein
MTAYILIKLQEVFGSYTIEPVGVYSDSNEALNWIDKLEKLNTDRLNVVFDVLEFEMDNEPIVLQSMIKNREQLIDAINGTLLSLMKKELIEQYVGEDGNFYYELTDKGKRVSSGVPGQILRRFIDAQRQSND